MNKKRPLPWYIYTQNYTAPFVWLYSMFGLQKLETVTVWGLYCTKTVQHTTLSVSTHAEKILGCYIVQTALKVYVIISWNPDDVRWLVELSTAVGVSLDSSAKKQLVLLATCHVHWDPEFCDVKLIQTMMFMHRLQNIIKDAQTSLLPPSASSDCNQIPVILCGDLNSLPESGMFSLVFVAVWQSDLKSHKYVCITTFAYHPDTKSNPNSNPKPTAKQHTTFSEQSTKYSHMSYVSR